MALGMAVASGRIGAAGTATLRLPIVGRNPWTVTQVTVNGTVRGATAVGPSATCGLYLNGILVSRTVAQGGVIAGDPPTLVYPSDRLTLEWAAGVVGAAVEALFQYDDGQTPPSIVEPL